MNEKLYALKEEFLATWPIERLKQMTLEEYTNLDKTSFCYWIEAVTTDLGSVWGGSAYKFGIFKRRELGSDNYNEKRKTDGEYAWYGKYGDTKDVVFENIRKIIIGIAKAAQSNTLELIDDIDLGNTLKWKIAFMYGDFNCLNAFKLDALRVMASNLDVKYTNKTAISQFHREILRLKPEDIEYFTWSHELWRQYETRLIDVKKDFAKWLNKNTFDSYRAYLGYTNKGIEDKLEEINSFFDEVDFFLVDPAKINGLVSTILFMMSKKERLKNPDFIEYDSKNSNGIPKAILGKNNYIKFLKERFDYVVPNYWIFQGNPEIYNTTEALRTNNLKHWKVAAHKDKIKPGDKVIIWQTGNKSGCYALAEVASEVQVFEEDSSESQYYIKPQTSENSERVKLRINSNLAEAPIKWSQIKDLPEFENFNAGNQGTNFKATEQEYNTLLKLLESKLYPKLAGENEFRQIIEFHNKQDILNYFGFLDTIIQRFDIQSEDPRMVTGTSNKQLNLTIGQRYCWNLHSPNRKRGKFGLITVDKINDQSEPFEGSGKIPFYNYFDDYNFALENRRSAFDAIENELNRTTKSSFTKHNNESYRKAIFDIDYRNHILDASEFTQNFQKEKNMQLPQFPLNQILYGPPGTGKTYRLQADYFDHFTIKESLLSRQQFILNIIADKTWWQVLTMAVLDLGNISVDAILNHELVKTKIVLGDSKLPRNTIWGTLQAHTLMECPNVGVKDRSNIQLFWKDENSYWKVIIENVEEQYPEAISILESIKHYKPDSATVIKNYEFVTFHQSFSYEDFIEGIKPKMEEEDSELEYEIADGVFKRIALRAKADPDNHYAIFIDEINRGNVSAIFGELITLIEEDKRSNGKNPLSVKLPYSKKEFEVPSNLYIFGTMNTADRSVEALDTALRRRFSFKEVMPNPSLVRKIEFDSFNLEEVLETINERIEFLLDRDHTIGHSYFMNLESNDIDGLEEVFKNKVIPLLQEYFYHDYEKIALILGSGFVKVTTNHVIKFPKFEGITEPDNLTLCELIVDIDDIEKAVLKLLNKNAE